MLHKISILFLCILCIKNACAQDALHDTDIIQGIIFQDNFTYLNWDSFAAHWRVISCDENWKTNFTSRAFYCRDSTLTITGEDVPLRCVPGIEPIIPDSFALNYFCIKYNFLFKLFDSQIVKQPEMIVYFKFMNSQHCEDMHFSINFDINNKFYIWCAQAFRDPNKVNDTTQFNQIVKNPFFAYHLFAKLPLDSFNMDKWHSFAIVGLGGKINCILDDSVYISISLDNLSGFYLETLQKVIYKDFYFKSIGKDEFLKLQHKISNAKVYLTTEAPSLKTAIRRNYKGLQHY